MVGPNGVGKSAFLRALELFYEVSPRITIEDFFGRDMSAELVITVTYEGLSHDARMLFARYVVGDQLTIERVFRSADGGKIINQFCGALPRHAAFRDVRDGLEVKDRGKTARAAYDALRQAPAYSALPDWSTLGEVPEVLAAWERANLSLCVRERDDGKFFGLSEPAPGHLGRFTHLLYVPAVREASTDASDVRGSVLTALMDLVVRAALTDKEDYRRLHDRTQVLYRRVMDPLKLTELKDLAEKLSSTLRIYVPEAAIELTWRALGEVVLPLPSADVQLVEGEYNTSVERTGHGLQRAFIMTMLQQLTLLRTAPSGDLESGMDRSVPNLVLAIEEPELYQHPSRQRHFAKTLRRLSSEGGNGDVGYTQIVCATHSPLFVSIERIDEIRLLRKEVPAPGLPKATTVVSTSLDDLADTLWRGDGEPTPRYTGATLLPRMKQIMTPWVNEGFFADVVVLVEGEDDRAAVLATAQIMNLDLDGGGFAVLPVGGKTSLDRPFAAFTALGIPTYVIWDGDKGKKDARPSDNRRLLRLLGQPEIDWPCEVGERFASFENDLDTTMVTEIGSDVYELHLTQCQVEFAIPKRDQALKNPAVVARLLETASQEGRECVTLNKIVKQIARLKK